MVLWIKTAISWWINPSWLFFTFSPIFDEFIIVKKKETQIFLSCKTMSLDVTEIVWNNSREKLRQRRKLQSAGTQRIHTFSECFGSLHLAYILPLPHHSHMFSFDVSAFGFLLLFVVEMHTYILLATLLMLFGLENILKTTFLAKGALPTRLKNNFLDFNPRQNYSVFQA